MRIKSAVIQERMNEKVLVHLRIKDEEEDIKMEQQAEELSFYSSNFHQ